MFVTMSMNHVIDDLYHNLTITFFEFFTINRVNNDAYSITCNWKNIKAL